MNVLPLFVAVPLGMAFLTPIFARFWKGFPGWMASLALLFNAGLTLWFLKYAGQTHTLYIGGWTPFNGIPIGISMVLDGLTVFMLVIVNGIGLMATLFSINYMSHYTDHAKYYTLFLLLMAGLNGVTLTGDMFNLFVFFEITAISAYSLVAFGVEAEELEASFKYQVLGGVASCIILLALAIFYQLTGTLNMADGSRMLSQAGPSPAVVFVSILFFTGFGLKAALMPFHAWLPDAHPSAPAPISAMLSGVVIKVLGVYAMLRVFFNIFGTEMLPFLPTLFIVLGTLSMVAGAFLALGQKDLKRLLAYSSISQIGYVIFAIGLGTPLAIMAGLFHLLNHAVFKSLLFFNSGAVVYNTDTRDFEKLGGLSQKMPVTASTAIAGSLSISGLPPLGGFWSKYLIILAAVQSRHYILAGVAILISIVTLGYYMKFMRYTFFGSLKASYQKIKEVPVLMCVSMIILAVLTIGMGVLLLPALRESFLGAAAQVVVNGVGYVKSVLGG